MVGTVIQWPSLEMNLWVGTTFFASTQMCRTVMFRLVFCLLPTDTTRMMYTIIETFQFRLTALRQMTFMMQTKIRNFVSFAVDFLSVGSDIATFQTKHAHVIDTVIQFWIDHDLMTTRKTASVL